MRTHRKPVRAVSVQTGQALDLSEPTMVRRRAAAGRLARCLLTFAQEQPTTSTVPVMTWAIWINLARVACGGYDDSGERAAWETRAAEGNKRRAARKRKPRDRDSESAADFGRASSDWDA